MSHLARAQTKIKLINCANLLQFVQNNKIKPKTTRIFLKFYSNSCGIIIALFWSASDFRLLHLNCFLFSYTNCRIFRKNKKKKEFLYLITAYIISVFLFRSFLYHYSWRIKYFFYVAKGLCWYLHCIKSTKYLYNCGIIGIFSVCAQMEN